MTALVIPRMQSILLTLGAVIALVVLALLKMYLPRKETPANYHSRARVVTPAERSFFGALEMALGSQNRIFPKIRLADLIEPAAGSDRRRFHSAFNRIAAKHADFTICRESDLAILGVVEPDDKSHDQLDRRARDRFLAQTGTAG